MSIVAIDEVLGEVYVRCFETPNMDQTLSTRAFLAYHVRC